VKILRPTGFNNSSILTALSTRIGGPPGSPFGMNLSFTVGDLPANVQRNRELFLGELGVAVEELAIPRQVHSSRVLRADRPGAYEDCDALVTNVKRLFLCVSFADCIPLFLFEKEKQIVAAVHSGWRGTAASIATEAVRTMTAEYGADPAAMAAYVGPAASICCYAVSPNVASRFDSRFVRESSGERFVDLKGAVVAQLLAAGVPAAEIEVNPLCTISESSLFHSFRRDGTKSGRMMGLIGRIR
jgi:polyphenol oxidase